MGRGFVKLLFGRVLTGALLILLSACPASPPVITVQPRSPTVIAGEAAAFSVTATGAAPLAYQWQRNETDIVGATASSYTTPAAALTDTGTRFQVKVSNPNGSVTSCIATLTVIASGAPSSGDPACPLVTQPPAGPPSPPSPPSPSPSPPPGPPSPPSPPAPPGPPPPPPSPPTPWTVPVKKWNATFKITSQETTSEGKRTQTVEGSAVFATSTVATHTIVSESGSFTVDASETSSSNSACKLVTHQGAGTIGAGDGAVGFMPNDGYTPTSVQYAGQGVTYASVTTTYSNCPPPTPKPSTTMEGELWLYIPITPAFFTTPDLLSFSDRWVDTVSPTETFTSEWSFTRVN
jgi:hypothetical protein